VRIEFESIAENQVLKEAIIARMERQNGISFHDFMAMALYEPHLGYYSSGRDTIGRSGDYLTSPEVSPIFGGMVGRQLREMWEALGQPGRFKVVEAGAGNGTLCRDCLTWTRRAAPGLAAAISYVIVEPIARLKARQQQLVESQGLEVRVAWVNRLPRGIAGCVLSNELLDSMPVHRVTVQDGQLRQLFVNWNQTEFVEEYRRPSGAVSRYFEDLGLLPAEGCTAEVNLAATGWMSRAARALGRGFVLTFDYGYEAEELYASWRKDGTLLCFYRHNPSNDPYARIGRQDMTSHVDFTSLRRAGEAAGLRTLGLVSQAELLMKTGIGEALPPADSETDLEQRLARRRAVSELVDPAGLGRIKVLAQAKGVTNVRLSGFAGTGTNA